MAKQPDSWPRKMVITYKCWHRGKACQPGDIVEVTAAEAGSLSGSNRGSFDLSLADDLKLSRIIKAAESAGKKAGKGKE